MYDFDVFLYEQCFMWSDLKWTEHDKIYCVTEAVD